MDSQRVPLPRSRLPLVGRRARWLHKALYPWSRCTLFRPDYPYRRLRTGGPEMPCWYRRLLAALSHCPTRRHIRYPLGLPKWLAPYGGETRLRTMYVKIGESIPPVELRASPALLPMSAPPLANLSFGPNRISWQHFGNILGSTRRDGRVQQIQIMNQWSDLRGLV